jgi:hypothetical protein
MEEGAMSARAGLPPKIEAAMLEEMRLYFEAGDKYALLRAIRFCLNQKIVAPAWIVTAFFRATNKWYQMDVKTLDAALGVEWPKGKSMAAAKKRRKLQNAVYCAVSETRQRDPDRPIDDLLFEDVGKQFSVGKTLAKDYYRSAREFWERPTVLDALLKDLVVPGHSPRQRRKK